MKSNKKTGKAKPVKKHKPNLPPKQKKAIKKDLDNPIQQVKPDSATTTSETVIYDYWDQDGLIIWRDREKDGNEPVSEKSSKED